MSRICHAFYNMRISAGATQNFILTFPVRTSTCHIGHIWRCCHLRSKAQRLSLCMVVVRSKHIFVVVFRAVVLTVEYWQGNRWWFVETLFMSYFRISIREARCDCPKVQSYLLLRWNWFQAPSRSHLEIYITWRIYVSPTTSSAVRSRDRPNSMADYFLKTISTKLART